MCLGRAQKRPGRDAGQRGDIDQRAQACWPAVAVMTSKPRPVSLRSPARGMTWRGACWLDISKPSDLLVRITPQFGASDLAAMHGVRTVGQAQRAQMCPHVR